MKKKTEARKANTIRTSLSLMTSYCRLILIVFLVLPAFTYSQSMRWMVFNTTSNGLGSFSDDIRALATDQHGCIWVGSAGGGLAKFDGVTWATYNIENSKIPSNFVNAVVIDSDGNVWVGTDKGLAKFNGTSWAIYNDDNSSIASNEISAITIDNAGNLWVGTSHNGMTRFDGIRWTSYTTYNSDLSNNDVRAVATDRNGKVWIGTDGGGLSLFDGKKWTSYSRESSSIPSDHIFSLAVDEQKTLWVGTVRGLVRSERQSWVFDEMPGNGLLPGWITAIAVDARGNKWLGTSDNGFMKLEGGNWTIYNEENSKLPDNSVNAIIVDQDGNKWVGTSGGLVVCSEKGVDSLLDAQIADSLNTIHNMQIDSLNRVRRIETLRKYFSENGLDQLGYTDQFMKDFASLNSGKNNEVIDDIIDRVRNFNSKDILSAYIGLATVFKMMGNVEQCIKILDKVVQVEPGNPTAYIRLAEVYFSTEDYDDIIRVLGNTNDYICLRYIALAYEGKQMFADANGVWRRIASSAQSVSLVNEANEHIRQNTIALMTTNQSQTKIEQNANLVPRQQPTTQPVLATEKLTRSAEPARVAEVDSDIPKAVEQHSNAIALILSIPQYQSSRIPGVKYAKNDAEILRQYLIKSLGFKPENILPSSPDEQLTYGRIQTYIKSILPSYLKPDGSSDLFIYFTGHGAPSLANREAYLVPWDGDPNYVNDNNSYSMKKFYVDIELLNARHKIIVVDACFSGYSGGGETLLKSASPIYLKLNNPLVADPNTVIFQSSSVNQVSNWYDEKRHGMFTYFFLKGLQGAADYNGDGAVTADELMKYINDQNEGLPYWSNRLYQRPQEAQLEGNGQTVIERIEK